MKKISCISFMLTILSIIFFALSVNIFAQSEIPPAGVPVLTTSAGQSADIMTLNILMDEAGVLYDYCDVPTVEMMKAGVGLSGVESGPGFHVEIKTDQSKYPIGTAYQSIVFAIGASLKGMGASGLTVDQELARLKSLIKYAKENKIFIVAAHVGGLSTRGNPGSDNEKMIDAIAPSANLIIVTADGNKDGRFTALAEENQIPLVVVDYALDVIEVLKQVFAGELTGAKCE
ncbi:MAG: hypothetical protein JXC36_01595 [Candidatus Atribacteria bacterium]|nr:hypothetical protein [Candidatus Atribacteria bacterium]